MLKEVRVPKMGMSTLEVDLLHWKVSVGSVVRPGEPMAEVETEKVAVTLEVPFAGRIAGIVVQEGETVNVGDVICVIDTADEAGG